MKKSASAVFLLICILCSISCLGQPVPGTNSNIQLGAWPFSDTNWLSAKGFAPVNFTNIFNVQDGNGDCVWLDTTNSDPAFLLYNVVETNGSTNILCSNGSISLWFNPDWSSTNQGGTGPGDWANLISLGQAGTNGTPWWAWYFSPDGCTVYFSSQTNGGSSSNYLSAPVSLSAYNWYNLVLTYSQTDSAFYTNGVLVTNGTGVAYWPGPDVTLFAVGSDTNGLFQAGGEFDDLLTYNYPMDTNMVAGWFEVNSIFYGLAGFYSPLIVSAPSTNTVTSLFKAVTGPGFLIATNASPAYPTSTNIWITNYSTIDVASNVINFHFAVAGGSNGIPYDVFATTALQSPITNAVWFWMGQAFRGTNYILPLTNYPRGNIFLILGKPQDSDLDGLTDAFERLITHTDPFNADTDYDGRSDGHEYVDGTNPLLASSVSNVTMASWSFDNTNTWVGDQGQTPLIASNLAGC